MKYKTMTKIKHSGETFDVGAEIELTEADAANLLKSGAIEPLIKPFSKQFEKTALHSNNQE
ncbi:MAG: hypothetical protein Q8J80_09825 [Gallionella sp.]|nr:hypothetical protein [Gallionella sp.]